MSAEEGKWRSSLCLRLCDGVLLLLSCEEHRCNTNTHANMNMCGCLCFSVQVCLVASARLASWLTTKHNLDVFVCH